jgi:anti-anti-sigma factor
MGIRIIEETDSLIHAALAGKLDFAAVRDMEKDFDEKIASGCKSVLLDMYETTFLSSMAMRMLLAAAKKLAEKGRKMALLNPHRLAELGIKAAGLDAFMRIEHDKTKAIKFLTDS